jgi:hypothetical protein
MGSTSRMGRTLGWQAEKLRLVARVVGGGTGRDRKTLRQDLGILLRMGKGRLKMMISSLRWGRGSTMVLAGGGMLHDVEILMAIGA